MKNESPEQTIKRLMETPEQAKAIVFANEFSETLLKYEERAYVLGLTVLAKTYHSMSGMIRNAAEVQLRTFRDEGTLINQLEQSVIETSSRQPETPKPATVQNMFTGETELPHDATTKRKTRKKIPS